MQLKAEQKVTFHVDCYDLDEFITHHYAPIDYCFVADMESSNDVSHTFGLTFGDKLSKWDIEKIEKFKQGKGSYMTATLLQDLCNRGLIDPGLYVINVCW